LHSFAERWVRSVKEECLSHIYKDVCGLALAKGRPSLIYHEPVLEVRFMRRGSGHDENFDHNGGNLADVLTAQSLVKPSALHSSESTPLCTKNNPVGSYFFFTEASRG
jgi:hypothetical protein